MAANLQKILPFEESGNFDSNNLIIFLHGYPDTADIWKDISSKVDKDAFILNFSYPNYSERYSKMFGFTQLEVVKRIKEIVDIYQKIKQRDITIVAHDWGAILAYMLDKNYPGYFKQMITLDVAAWLDRSPKVMKVIITYQFKLALAFIIGFILPFIGNFITDHVVRGYFKYQPVHYKRINYRWNYFYVYFIFNTIVAKFKPQAGYLYQYKPNIPVVFMYGEKKVFYFHSQKWVEYLQNNKGCECFGVQTDHWIPQKQGDLVVSTIKRRLQVQ
ncbi:hypothetical protein ABPG72_016763 [Tetrahymena utriculariae]